MEQGNKNIGTVALVLCWIGSPNEIPTSCDKRRHEERQPPQETWSQHHQQG